MFWDGGTPRFGFGCTLDMRALIRSPGCCYIIFIHSLSCWLLFALITFREHLSTCILLDLLLCLCAHSKLKTLHSLSLLTRTSSPSVKVRMLVDGKDRSCEDFIPQNNLQTASFCVEFSHFMKHS